MSPPPHATREAVVEALYRDVDGLSPRLKDRRLIRRFAATRDHDRARTRRLLVEYDKFYAKSGLLDDHLGRDPGCAPRCDDGGPCASSIPETPRAFTTTRWPLKTQTRGRLDHRERGRGSRFYTAHALDVAHGAGQGRLPGGVHEP